LNSKKKNQINKLEIKLLTNLKFNYYIFSYVH